MLHGQVPIELELTACKDSRSVTAERSIHLTGSVLTNVNNIQK